MSKREIAAAAAKKYVLSLDNATANPPADRFHSVITLITLGKAEEGENINREKFSLRSLPPIPSPGRCSWPRTSLLIFQCTAPELCQRATHSLRSARPHGARPAVPMAAVAFLHHAPLATTKKPIAVPRSRAARADVRVVDGRLPRQRRLLNRAILQASSEAISWPSDSIAVGVYLHRLPGADPT